MLKQIVSVLIVAAILVPLGFVTDYAARVALENRKPCECKCDCKPAPVKPTGSVGEVK